jgi:hypothetical protein
MDGEQRSLRTFDDLLAKLDRLNGNSKILRS